jgi:hypothetical protein
MQPELICYLAQDRLRSSVVNGGPSHDGRSISVQVPFEFQTVSEGELR